MSLPPTPDPAVSLERFPSEVIAAYLDLEDFVRTAHPQEDLSLLRQAFLYAADHHSLQRRNTGEPYILHPIAVTRILAQWQLDLVCLLTGLLHDTVEDTSATLDDLRKRFGNEVVRCVDGVTKLTKLNFYSREERQAESMRKMLLAMVEDIRVILVKLADRLHNSSSLLQLPQEKRERIAQETLDLYAPIANRLGMGKVRSELEDLAFHALDPDAYEELQRDIEQREQANEEHLTRLRQEIQQKLEREGIPARVDGRIKRVYSVYQKLKRQKIPLEQVYDLMGLRIVTDSVKDCYAALGVIHNDWHPIPGRIKDFIAIPRPNMYQSLHTSVIGPGGISFEVQIRTEEMHRVAEEGIAAHWRYKEGRHGKGTDDQQIQWLRSLVEWQHDVKDPSDFINAVQMDLYQDEVYAFTPKGRIVALPRDSSPIDFAYAIHSDIGNSCQGARVNGSIVPLRYKLHNGDVVEILTSPHARPTKDWLTLVKTSRARNRIRHVLQAVERPQLISLGQGMLHREAQRHGVPNNLLGKNALEVVAGENGYGRVEDLYYAIGFGKVNPRSTLRRLAPAYVKTDTEEKTQTVDKGESRTGDFVLKIDGADGLLIYRAGCCNPIKGEPVLGYITRGKGLAIHAKRCINVRNGVYEPERRIEAAWDSGGNVREAGFPVQVMIYTDDRPGILAQFTNIIFDAKSNIRSLEARSDDKRGDGAIVDMRIDVRDTAQLSSLVQRLKGVDGVRDVERVH